MAKQFKKRLQRQGLIDKSLSCKLLHPGGLLYSIKSTLILTQRDLSVIREDPQAIIECKILKPVRSDIRFSQYSY